MRVIGSAVAILWLCATSIVARPSLRGDDVEETAHHLDVKPFTPCGKGLQVWVRADDLKPSDITEGDARLVNNLTELAHDADLLARCRVQSWTLGLRHRERVALKYPAPDVQLPPEPQYNYTWDDIMLEHRYGGYEAADEDYGIETSFDSHTAERLAYDKKLEEYAHAVRNHDHWIVHEQERHNFEALWPMGDVEAPLENLQVVAGKPFAVAVPATVFAPKVSGRSSSSHGKGAPNITYVQELDISYVAYVTMADGDVIEVSAGETTFIPPASWPTQGSHRQHTRRRSIHFTADTEVVALYDESRDDDELAAAGPRQTKLPDLDFSLSFSEVPAFVQGEKIMLNATAMFNGTSYELDSASIKVVQHVRPTWASAILRQDKRDTQSLQGELLAAAGLESVFISPSSSKSTFYSQVYSSGGISVPGTVAQYLKETTTDCESGAYGYGGHRDWPCWGCSNTEMQPAGPMFTHLQSWANFTDNAAFTTREAAFEVVEAAFLIELTIRENIVDEAAVAELAPNPTRHEVVLQEQKLHWNTKHCLLRANDDDKKAKRGKRYRITAAIEGLTVLPRDWTARKRDARLEQRLRKHSAACSKMPVSHLSSSARAPIFVDPAEVGTVVHQLCTPSTFPLLNATVTSRQRVPDLDTSDSTLRFVTNRWHRKHILSHEFKKAERFSWYEQPGTAGKEVGKVWAEMVLAPMVKAEMEEAVRTDAGSLLADSKQMVFS